MPPVLIDWALPATGALGLWLTAGPGPRMTEWAWKHFGKTDDIGAARIFARFIDGKAPRVLGYTLGLAGQPIWLWWTYQQIPEVYGPFVTSVLFTLAWARGLWRARRG